MPDVPSTRSVLGLLTNNRLLELARDLEVAVPSSGKKDVQVEALVDSGRLGFRGVVEKLGREEDIVQVRHRPWLVGALVLGDTAEAATRFCLAYNNAVTAGPLHSRS